jgi:hypothetical protein
MKSGLTKNAPIVKPVKKSGLTMKGRSTMKPTITTQHSHATQNAPIVKPVKKTDPLERNSLKYYMKRLANRDKRQAIGIKEESLREEAANLIEESDFLATTVIALVDQTHEKKAQIAVLYLVPEESRPDTTKLQKDADGLDYSIKFLLEQTTRKRIKSKRLSVEADKQLDMSNELDMYSEQGDSSD